MRRGVKPTSINTKELIRIYTNERIKTLTTIPHQGITKDSFDTLASHLRYLQQYIEQKKHTKTKIEDIPPGIGKGLGLWIKEQHKQRYSGRERSNETINHTIAAVKKMYRDVAIDEKYITMAELPIFRYLKISKKKSHKRDIIEPEEFMMLRRWMAITWCREKGISDLERIKRYVYCQYLIINYFTGCRNKEMLGIQNFEKDDFVLINLSQTKRGTNTPYDQPAIEKRLKAVIEGSGLKKILDETGRHITQYSARHYAATDALMRGVSIYDVAVNLGTSVHYIEQTYSKVTALKKSTEITKGQGIYKIIEEKATKTGKATR